MPVEVSYIWPLVTNWNSFTFCTFQTDLNKKRKEWIEQSVVLAPTKLKLTPGAILLVKLTIC